MKSSRLDLKQLTVCAAILAAGVFASAQEPKQGPTSVPAAGSAPATAPMKSETTLKATTRMVTVEVVARDRMGHPVTGLTAKDFQIFEQVPPKRDQFPQTIAAFQAVSLAEISAANKGPQKMPAGVYTNAVSMQPKVAVPPTVLLMDGLNTSLEAQMQVRRQMVKMLASIPEQVPVAVFLMGRRLRMVQGFTTDPKLLREAVQKAISMDVMSVEVNDPRDNPDPMFTLVEEAAAEQQAAANSAAASAPGGGSRAVPQQGPNALGGNLNSPFLDALARFERESYTANWLIRIDTTLDALRAISRYVAGYPGRKNLLWISSGVPLSIFPDEDNKFVGAQGRDNEVKKAVQALADAKVAVYPMDPSGLATQSYMGTQSNPKHPSMGGSGAIIREDSRQFDQHESMRAASEETGGRVCVYNNDLADCVKKAVDDGSSYYELAYYPDSSHWHGEFHRVVVKTTASGVHLAYRKGYFAQPDESLAPVGNKGAKQTAEDLQQAACQDLLPSTALLVVAEAIPADQPGQVRYFIAIDSGLLSFVPAEGGGQELHLTAAFCTFDKQGQPLQYMPQQANQRLTDKEYAAVMAHHGMPHVITLVPKPGTVRVRLLVRDGVSGLMGSVDVPYSETASTPPPAPAPASTAGPAPGSPN